MMKRLFVCLMILTFALTAAFAEETGLTYSARFRAVNAAQHALAEKYAVSEGCNEYFVRTVTEENDGSYTVRWEPAFEEGGWPWLLGTYTAKVRGEDAEISWSNDGKSTEGGFRAEAWGAEQLRMIAEEIRTTFEMIGIYNAVLASPLSQKEEEYPFTEEENGYANMEEERKTALEAAVITAEDADAMARLALQEICGAREWWRLETTDGEYNWDIGLLNGRPVIVIHYDLWGQGSDEWEWQEGDGTYVVTVNLATGEIEEILYANGLSGNG